MDVNTTIAEFVHRYQSLSVHRDTQDNLIKVNPKDPAAVFLVLVFYIPDQVV